MICDSSTSDEVLANGVRNLETLINWNCMSYTITRVAYETSSSTIWIKRKNCLNSNVETFNSESFEHKLCHLFSVDLRIKRSFSKHNFVLGGVYTEFIWKTIFPDLLHQIPRCYNARFNRIWKLQDTSHFLSFITNVFRFWINTNHLLIRSWYTNNWWEFNWGSVFFRKTSLDDSWTIVDNNIFARHF